MKYCHCSPLSMDDLVARPTPLGAGIKADFMYLHEACEGWHHAVPEKVAVVRAPAERCAPLSYHGVGNGQSISRGSIDGRIVETVGFYPWTRRNPMSQDEPLLYSLWELLMSKIPAAVETPEDPWDGLGAQTQKTAKAQVRALCEALAIIMNPFLPTADDVGRAAMKKYKDPTYEVPGLAPYLWDPSKNYDGSDRVQVATKSAPAAKPAARPKVDNTSTKQLTAEEKLGIRDAVGSGMFSEEDVAAMFKVSIATVQAALA